MNTHVELWHNHIYEIFPNSSDLEPTSRILVEFVAPEGHLMQVRNVC